MRWLFSFVMLIMVSGYASNAQRFERYLKHWPDSTERLYRDYMLGLRVVNENGQEMKRTEPVFSSYCFDDGFDRAAVCIPLNTMDYGERGGYEVGRIWVCVDYDFKPVFIFPSNTYSVFRIQNEMFLYSDMPAHYGTMGLIDRSGSIIFEAPYDGIYFENEWIVGVKQLPQNDEISGREVWLIEYKKASSDSLITLELKTPQQASAGLWAEHDPTQEKESTEQLLQEDVFQRALNHVVHCRIKEAKACFERALKSDNQDIIDCSEFNLNKLDCLE